METPQTGLSRRTVVRAAAHAAWAAPVVIVATNAPAFAGSGPPYVTTDILAANRDTFTGTSTFVLLVKFTNVNTDPTTAFQTLIDFRVTEGVPQDLVPDPHPPGYVLTNTTYSGRTASYTYVAEAPLGGSGSDPDTSTQELQVNVDPTGNTGLGPFIATVTAVPTPGVGTSQSAMSG